jgi:hypothetical protein
VTRIGDYEVEGEIGRGGAGRVLRARHAATGAVRAVKVLEDAADPVTIERFRREAQALARVGPDVAVAVHETGAERGRVFYVMDLMPGGSLEGRLGADARIGWREAAALVARLARGVARCHAVGIVHRDLKPANVLFDESGEPRLADFGCARDLRQSALTETGTLIGTPAYMAPEQLDGRHAGSEADVYALGAILHELVAGAPPHPFRSWHDLLQRTLRGLEKPVAAAAGAPSELDRILAATLAAEPRERPVASELARRLESLGETSERGRGGALVLLAGAGLLGLVVLLSLSLSRGVAPPPAPASIESEEQRLARIRRGDVRPGELESLAATVKGPAVLHGLAEGAVVVPLVAVAGVTSESSTDLRTIAAFAHVASTVDPAERRRWLLLLQRERPGGDAGLLVPAALAVLDEIGRAGDMVRHPGAELDGPLRPIAKRPDLVGIAVAPLITLCRMDLLEHVRLATQNGVSLKKCDALFGALDSAPAEVAADYLVKLDGFPGEKEPGWSRAHARRRAALLTRQADRLEAKGDRLLALLVYLNAVDHETVGNEWDDVDFEHSQFARDVEHTRALFAWARTDAEALPAIPQLDWELPDSVSRGMFYWLGTDKWGLGPSQLARTLEEVDRALAHGDHARGNGIADDSSRKAALLIALGRPGEVGAIAGLDPEEPVRTLAALPVDLAALERVADRYEADPRPHLRGPALAIRIGIGLGHGKWDEARAQELSKCLYVPGHLVMRTTERLVRDALRK